MYAKAMNLKNNQRVPTLHLLMGLPGSGKTTLGKILEKITDATYLSSDEYRLMLFKKPCFSQEEHDMLYATLDHNVLHLLESGHDVIYDANLNRRHHRQEKYDLASKYNADVKLWWVKTPHEISKKRRIKNQDARLIPEGETAERMFDRVTKIIEHPDKDEKYIEVDGSKIDTNLPELNL
jgi:predicted kinase